MKKGLNFILFLLVCNQLLHAQVKQLSTINFGHLLSAYNTPLQAVEDDRYAQLINQSSSWKNHFKVNQVTNLIKLSVNHEFTTPTQSYRYKFNFQVTAFNENGNQSTFNVSIPLSYNPAAFTSYNDASVHRFYGAHKFYCTLISVTDLNTNTNITFSALKKNFKIEQIIAIDRYEKSSYNHLVPVDSISINQNNGKIHIDWSAIQVFAPTTFELEWLHVDDYGGGYSNFIKDFTKHQWLFNDMAIPNGWYNAVTNDWGVDYDVLYFKQDAAINSNAIAVTVGKTYKVFVNIKEVRPANQQVLFKVFNDNGNTLSQTSFNSTTQQITLAFTANTSTITLGIEYPNAPLSTLYGAIEDITIVETTYEPQAGNLYKKPDFMLPYQFNKNTTRIRTSSTKYTIENVFESGYLLYRIRRVRPDSVNQQIERISDWNLLTTQGTINNLPASLKLKLNAHESDSFNWNYQITYAEQGLKSDAVGYFDGLLKPRQQVTLNNSDSIAIVGETKYDYNGRPAVQIVPAPAVSITNTANYYKSLQYYNNFNRNLQNKPYSAVDFDLSVDTCMIDSAGKLATNSGASRYYSPQNPDQQKHQQYLPDAENYPFVQSEYMPDNTGRIKRQSGIGKHHKLGSGHETFYEYSAPMQNELDMIFGSEIGFQQHYKKQTIKDANGQISVSYTDLSGKVIATSLAESSPGNVDSLSSIKQPTLMINRLNDKNIFDGTSISLNFEATLNKPGPVYIDYRLSTTAFNQACLPANFCFKCSYVYEIKLIDKACSKLVFSYYDTIAGINPADTLCGTLVGADLKNKRYALHAAYPIVDTAAFDSLIRINHLPASTYSLSKTLRLNPAAIDYYQELYLQKANCVLPYDTFLQRVVAQTDFSSCENCSTCTNVPDIGYCDAIYQLLLGDVTPGGQYAQYSVAPNGNDLIVEDSLVSVLKSTNYKKITHFTSFGQPDYITFPNGVVDLASKADPTTFIRKFKSSWADSLVILHPEYCYYQYCKEKLSGSYEYDFNKSNIFTYDSAFKTGYLNPTGITGLKHGYPIFANAIDPLFATNTALKNNMSEKLLNYTLQNNSIMYDAWQTAAIITLCSPIKDEKENYACIQAIVNQKVVDSLFFDKKQRDRYWQAFMGIYNDVKNTIIDSLMQTAPATYSTPRITYPAYGTIGSAGPYQSYTKRFMTGNFSGIDRNNHANLNQAVMDKSDEVLRDDSSCYHTSIFWMEQLNNCPLITASNYENIRADFQVLCEQAKVYQQYPSVYSPAVVPANIPNVNYHNIHEILTHYFGSSYANMLCNAELIANNYPANHDYYEQSGKDCKCNNGLQIVPPKVEVRQETKTSYGKKCIKDSFEITPFGTAFLNFINEVLDKGALEQNFNDTSYTSYKNGLKTIAGIGNKTRVRTEIVKLEYRGALAAKNRTDWRINFLDSVNDVDRCNIFFNLDIKRAQSSVFTSTDTTKLFKQFIPLSSHKFIAVFEFKNNQNQLDTIHIVAESGCKPIFNLNCVAYSYDTIFGTPFMADSSKLDSFIQVVNGIRNGTADSLIGKYMGNDGCTPSGFKAGGAGLCELKESEKAKLLVEVLSELLYTGRMESDKLKSLTDALPGNSSWMGSSDPMGFYNLTLDKHSPTYVGVFGLDWSRYNGYRGFAFDPNNDLNANCLDDRNIYADPEFIGISHFGIGIPTETGSGDILNCTVSFGDPYKTGIAFNDIDSFANYRFDSVIHAWVVTAYILGSGSSAQTATLRVKTCKDLGVCDSWKTLDSASTDKKYRHNVSVNENMISFECAELNRYYDEISDFTCPDDTYPNTAQVRAFTPLVLQKILTEKANNQTLTSLALGSYSTTDIPATLSFLQGGDYQTQHLSDSLLIAFVGDMDNKGCHLSLRYLGNTQNSTFSFGAIDRFSKIRPDREMIAQLAAEGEFNRAKHYFIIQGIDDDANKTYTFRGWLSCQEVFSCMLINAEPLSSGENCGCLTCPEFKEALHHFDSIYPFATIGHELYEKMVTNFLNRELNNNLTYLEYESFKQTCKVELMPQQPAKIESDLELNLTYNLNCFNYIDALVKRIEQRTGYTLRYTKTKLSTSSSAKVVFQLDELPENDRIMLMELIEDSVSIAPCFLAISNITKFNAAINDININIKMPIGVTPECVSAFNTQLNTIATNRFGTSIASPIIHQQYLNFANDGPGMVWHEYPINLPQFTSKKRNEFAQVVDSLSRFCSNVNVLIGFEQGGAAINKKITLVRMDTVYLGKYAAPNVSCDDVYDAVLRFHDSIYKYRPSYIREAAQVNNIQQHLYNWHGYKVTLTQETINNVQYLNVNSPTSNGLALVNIFNQLAEDKKLLSANVNISRYRHLLPNPYISGGTDSTYYTGTYQYFNKDSVWLTLTINKVGSPAFVFKVLADTFALNMQKVFGMQVGFGKFTFAMQAGASGMRTLYYGYGLQQTTALVNACSFPLPTLCFKPLVLEAPQSLSCTDQLMQQAELTATYYYNQYIDSIKHALALDYKNFCMQAAQIKEKINIGTLHAQYHYTLYYYDLAGNLIKTVPPAGVNTLTLTNQRNQLLDNNRRQYTTESHVHTQHTLATTYKYNSLSLLLTQNTPDAGLSRFYYDKLGRLVVSQNSAQKARGNVYSYTVRDALNRVTEVGEITAPLINEDSLMYHYQVYFNNWLNRGIRTQITRTYYDNPISTTINNLFVGGQQYLRSRVATTAYFEHNTTQYNHATHYSYDIHGNVAVLIQDMPELQDVSHRYKQLFYHYDLISGRVNMVRYEPWEADRFFHRYIYDNDNRLVQTLTSKDSVIWDADASYSYYKHGSLARTALGELNVQGIDYAYTIQGWLKAVNSNALDSSRDIGRDGHAQMNPSFAPDVYGFSLGYFNGDYTPINSAMHNTTQAAIGNINGSILGNTLNNLYNGNISHMVTAIKPLMQNGAPLAGVYRYDQLNRITRMQTFTGYNPATNQWQNGSAQAAYLSTFAYDANGNITKLYRAGSGVNSALHMDSLHYFYYAGTNKLNHVKDREAANAHVGDIDNQQAGNYQYDLIGNLAKDRAEEIDTITWNVYGKIRHIRRVANSTKAALEFRYDAMGQRAVKVVKNGADETQWQKEYYVRDAQGNIMATYQSVTDINNNEVNVAAISQWIITNHGQSGFIDFLNTHVGANAAFSNLLAQHLTQQGKAYDILNQYDFTLLLNTDPSMAYAVAVAIEGTSAEQDVMNGLEQYNTAKLWEALINCSSESLIRLFDYEILAAVNMLTQLCSMDRAKMNTIATQMGYSNVTTLTDVELVDLLISEQRYDEMVSLLLEQFTVSQIPIPAGTSGFSIATFILNIDGYEGFLQALNCYDTEQLKQFFINNPNYKQYLITGSQQQFLLEKLNEQNFVLYLQYVLQQNNINSINYAITNMQTQPVYNYLTWVKQSFGNSAYNSLASNLEFTRTLKLNDWQLYGSSRLGVYNADTTLTNITFTINGIDSNGNFEVNQVISQTSISVNHYDMQHELAYKQFELTSYNGNVLATVLDRKTNNNADIVSANNYYPFHSAMQSFSVANTNSYPYGGANGQMKDDEVFKGAYTAEFWQYDSRLGRRWNMDPVVKEQESPFAVFANNSNWFIDLNGDDSTQYIFSVVDPTTNKPVYTAEQMEAFRIETQKVFDENNININVVVIDYQTAINKKLDRTDAMVMITPWGPIRGNTLLSPFTGENAGWENNYLNIKKAEKDVEMINKHGGKMTLNEMIGILIAHEGWHQFLERARMDILGKPVSGGFQEGHLNLGLPNLNMDGDEMIKVFQNPSPYNLSRLRVIHNSQIQLVKQFFRLHIKSYSDFNKREQNFISNKKSN
ncbi:MAG: DUF6443 domain-containing protein [Bacteroidia bacterium]|jgi:hypothetical protein|nr:DUF6443 domain-containing protein [Bacteroidia bacterium]